MDLKADALKACIMRWTRDPNICIDRETYFDSSEIFDLSVDHPNVLLVIPWVIKELNMVGVPKDPHYLTDRLSVIETAGRFLEHAHAVIGKMYPGLDASVEAHLRAKVYQTLMTEYDTHCLDNVFFCAKK